MSAPTNAQDPALRSEHDALARRLEVRVSIDCLRKGLVRLFLGLIGTGTTVRLAWDRWGVLKPGVIRKAYRGPPLLLWIAVAATVVLLVLAVRSFLAARRLARDEDRLFSRFRQLRAELGLDR